MPVKTGTFVAVAIITTYKYVKLQNFKSIYQLIKKVHFYNQMAYPVKYTLYTLQIKH